MRIYRIDQCAFLESIMGRLSGEGVCYISRFLEIWIIALVVLWHRQAVYVFQTHAWNTKGSGSRIELSRRGFKYYGRAIRHGTIHARGCLYILRRAGGRMRYVRGWLPILHTE